MLMSASLRQPAARPQQRGAITTTTTRRRVSAIATSPRRRPSSRPSPSPLVAARASPAPFTGGPGEASGAGGGSGGAGSLAAATAAPPARAADADAQPPPHPQQQHQLPIVHVPFRWPAQLGGSRVSVFGSWDGWRQKVPLARSPVTGDFVRVLALPLDPQGHDGAVAGGAAGGGNGTTAPSGARQIEYKFEVEYDDDDHEEDGDGLEAAAGDGAAATKKKQKKTRVAVRPAPSDPVIRTAAPVFASDFESSPNGSRPSSPSCWTESHANNKRLLAPNKFFVLPGASPQDEVLAVTDYGGWHAAIPLKWNPRARRHEAAASLPAGAALSYRFLVNGRPALAPGGLLPVAPAPPPAPAGRLAHRDAALPPARAFTLFYATGWPSATLVYRFRLPHLAAAARAAAGEGGDSGDGGDGNGAFSSSSAPAVVPVTPWQQLPMDVAPSRDAPNGGRWMMAVVEPPPALRRDPWLLERRAEAEAEEATAGNGNGGNGNGSTTTTVAIANRVAALAAAPSPPCELEFFVRGPPIAPPSAEADNAAATEENDDDGSNAALAAPCPRHPEEDRGPGGGAFGHYVLPAPMAWKLSRGNVRKFPRALRPPTMLVSDLDHTLYAEGEAAAAALGRFTGYWEAEAALARSVLVYNTGRSLGQFVSLVNEQRGRLALPDVLVTAVGTKVFHLKAEWRGKGGGGFGGSGGNGSGGGGGFGGGYGSSSSYSSAASHPLVTEDDWQEDLAWSRRLDHGWDLARARQATERAIAAARDRFSRGWGDDSGPSYLPGDQVVNWLDDGSEHPHRVAVSCHVRATPFIVSALRSGMAAQGVKARVIVSGQGDWRYVDAVARRAGKAAALEHVRRLYGVQPERTMAAGDSCNDVLMLAAAADGGMAEALAAPLAQAAAAQAAAEAAAAESAEEGRGDGTSGARHHGHGHHDGAAAAAAAMLMMRDYWAGGGSRTFLDEASDLSSSGDRGGSGSASGSGSGSGSEGDDNAGGWVSPSPSPGAGATRDDEGEEEEDGDGGRAPRVRAVIVGNAQRELVEWYHSALKADTGAQSIVLASQALADGVLEGLMRHGLY